jgi:hypothetical protein
MDISSMSTTFYANKNGRLLNFTIDERRYNTFRQRSGNSSSFGDWLIDEHTKMKLSDDDYGTYGMNLPEDPDTSGLDIDIGAFIANMRAEREGNPTTPTKKKKLMPNSEGRKGLYAHDFMIWLKENQDNFKN